jgi:hypothetical protein
MKNLLCTLLVCSVCSVVVLGLSGCGCSNQSNNSGYTVETTAPDLTDGDFGYFIISENEIMLTEYRGTDKNVEIPESYQNYNVTVIGASVFTQTDIESVVIPDTVTEIQSYAFASCYSLRSVKLSENLKIIGPNAFFHTMALETIELPASIEDFGIYTFSASGLKSVTIPESETFTKLEDYIFFQCPNLKEVTIASTVTSINPNTFASCSNPITIKAASGSYAEQYAAENDFSFVAIE